MSDWRVCVWFGAEGQASVAEDFNSEAEALAFASGYETEAYSDATYAIFPPGVDRAGFQVADFAPGATREYNEHQYPAFAGESGECLRCTRGTVDGRPCPSCGGKGYYGQGAE